MTLPKGMWLVALVETLGILALLASQLAQTPPSYLITLVVGCACLMAGLVGFLVLLQGKKSGVS
jgi:hypothetical protein